MKYLIQASGHAPVPAFFEGSNPEEAHNITFVAELYQARKQRMPEKKPQKISSGEEVINDVANKPHLNDPFLFYRKKLKTTTLLAIYTHCNTLSSGIAY